MLDDYLNAIGELTILPENRQELQLRKQEDRISELERNQTKIEHLENGVNVIGALFAEQRVKNNIWYELESPTHHHAKEQIKSLKEFCMSKSDAELWQAFMEWSKTGPRVYSVGSKIEKNKID